MAITRRTLITIAGLTVGAVTLTTTPASAAPRLEPLDDQAVPVLTGASGALAVRPRQLGVRVGSAVTAGTAVTITYDPRLFAELPEAVVLHDGRRVRSSATTSIDAHGRHVTTVVIGEDVATAGLTVVAAVAYPLLYPADLVRAPIAAGATMAAGTRTLQPRRPAAYPDSVSAWGVELYPTWRAHTWGERSRFRYHYPVQVTLRGSGPGRAPRPAGFSITVDSRVLTDLRITHVALNGRSRGSGVRLVQRDRTATTHRQRFRTDFRLAEGDVARITLSPVTRDPGALSTIRHPVVSLWDMGTDPAQRVTGHTSSSRQDAVWHSEQGGTR